MKIATIATAIVLGLIRPFLSPHPVSLQGSYEASRTCSSGASSAPGWLRGRDGCLQSQSA